MANNEIAALEGGGQRDPSPEMVTQAKEMGWVPKEEFRGDPEKWVDADAFYERGQHVLPIIKKDRERLSHEVQSVKSELVTTQRLLAEAFDSLAEFKKYHDEDSKRQYERAYQKLKDEKRQALKEGDTDAVVDIDEAMDKLRDEEATPRTQPKEKPTAPVDYTKTQWFQEWVSQNASWYMKDKWKTSYAHSIVDDIRRDYPTLHGKDFLDKVAHETDKKFNTRRENPDRVEGSRGGGNGALSGKSYNDLPAEAKEACDRFAAKLVGPGKAYKTEAEWRKQYVKDFHGEAS